MIYVRFYTCILNCCTACSASWSDLSRLFRALSIFFWIFWLVLHFQKRNNAPEPQTVAANTGVQLIFISEVSSCKLKLSITAAQCVVIVRTSESRQKFVIVLAVTVSLRTPNNIILFPVVIDIRAPRKKETASCALKMA